MAGGENTSGLFLCPVLGGRYALGGVHSKISMTPFKFAVYQEFERRKGYDESIHLENNSPQEWEEISFSAFSKARRNGCFTGRFFVETVKMFRDEDDRIIMECSRKDFENTSRRTATAAISRNMRKVALYSRLLMWEIVTAQRKVIRIQICLWMNLLILRNKLFRIYFLRIYTKLY